MMDLRINPVDIAGGFLCPIGRALEDVDRMPASGRVRAIESKTKFHRHIEAGNPLRNFNPRKVMNRIIGLRNQTDDGFEPALIRNSERCIDVQAKLGQTYNVGNIQVFKLFIVWDVKKDGIDTLATCHLAPIACHCSWKGFEIRPASFRRRRLSCSCFLRISGGKECS